MKQRLTARRWPTLALGTALALATPASPEPLVTFQAPDIVASGLTPGGSAVWFGVARELEEDGGTTVRVRRAVVADVDGDGAVSYALGGEPALRSLWTAADLASGDVGVGTPEGFPRTDIPPEEVSLGESAGVDRLSVARRLVEVTVLRSGVGAWALTAADNTAADHDAGVEGQVEADLEDFTGVGEGAPPPPAAYEPGDLVVILGPDEVEVYVGRVEQAPGETAGNLVLVPILGGAS